MISSITLSGALRNKINDRYRYLEISRTPYHQEKPIIDLIPIAFWNPSPNSRLQRLEEGVYVVINGRLERDEEIGLYVMCERLEYVTNSEEKMTVIL